MKIKALKIKSTVDMMVMALIFFILNISSLHIPKNVFEIEDHTTYLVMLGLVFIYNYNSGKIKQDKTIIIFWVFLGIATYMSMVFATETDTLLSVVYIILAGILILKKFFNKERVISFYIAYLLSVVPVLIIWYRGGLYVNNAIGIMICYSAVVVINLLYLFNRNSINTLLLCAMVFGMLLFIVGQRTSISVFIIIISINLFHIVKQNNNINTIMKFLFICLGVSMIFIFLYKDIIQFMFNKHGNNVDLLAGRGTIWAYLLNRIKMWGNGHYILDILNTRQMSYFSAHNTLVEAISVYGVIVFGFLVLFFSRILRKLIIFPSNIYKLYILNFAILYGIISIFENLFFFDTLVQSSTLIFLMHTNLVCNYKGENNEK